MKIFKTILLMAVIFSNCSQQKEPIFKDTFKDSFYVGTAINRMQIMGEDPKSLELMEKHFNSLTPENLLKWEKVHPQPGQYDFEAADAFVNYGEKHNMFMVGHVLVWHSQTPAWVFENEDGDLKSREELLALLKDHIYTVVGRYKGRIQGWDVINEAFENDGSWRKSKWYKIIGEDYIEIAFKYAHEADPNAELYYNDFNMWYPGKVESVVKLVTELKEKEVPVHGIGLQGHWGLDYPPMDELLAAMEAYTATGVPMMVTEIDMDILPMIDNATNAEISRIYEAKKEMNPWPEELPDSMKTVQANRYKEFFDLFYQYREHISRITMWGVQDKFSWRNNWPIPGRSAYPLLFDENYQPKKAFYEVLKSVE